MQPLLLPDDSLQRLAAVKPAAEQACSTVLTSSIAAMTSRHCCLWTPKQALQNMGVLLPAAVKEVELKQRKAVAPPKKPMQLPDVKAPVVEHIVAPQLSAVRTEGVLQNYMDTLRAHKEHVARLQAAATTNQLVSVTDNLGDQQGASQAPDRPSVEGSGESQPGPQPSLSLQGEPKPSKRSSGGCCTICEDCLLFVVAGAPASSCRVLCHPGAALSGTSQTTICLLLRHPLCLAAHSDKLNHV